MSSASSPDLVVVGAGVIGSAVAYFAAQVGLRVTVFEGDKVGKQGSRVAAGLVAPSPQITGDTPFAQLARASLAYLPQLRDTLLHDTGIDIQLDPRGTLRVARSDDDAHAQQALLPIKQQLGFNLCWLTPHEVHALEPALSEANCGAVYGQDEAQLTTSRLLAAYRAGAERHGATFVRAWVEPIRQGRRVLGVMRSPQAQIGAGHVVIAGGAWTPLFAGNLSPYSSLPIRPQRGQVLVVRQYKGPVLHHIVFWDDLYLAPRKGRTVTIGAANDYPSLLEHHPTAAGVAQLSTQALEAVPSLGDAAFVAMRAGLRPRTPDKLPIIGPLPGWEGISIASGHNSNGLLFSAITALAIRAQLLDEQAPLDMSPYLPDRFCDDLNSDSLLPPSNRN
jgi:glycine oxidase